MSITAYHIKRVGTSTLVTVDSDLSSPIFYHWYQDGQFVEMTRDNTKGFFLVPGSHSRIEVNDTNDADYDSLGNAPAGYPGSRLLGWCRSVAADVKKYKIEQRVDGGDWTQVAMLRHENRKWYYTWRTGFLTDLSEYEWRIIPIDAFGNEGTALTFTAEKIVRLPDAPNFRNTYNESTDKLTFIEI